MFYLSQTTGQLESVESVEAEAGAYLISFKSRAAAEQVCHSALHWSPII